MACADCRARAALVAGLAAEIERIARLNRQSLLSLLALGDVQLCRAAGVTDIRATLQGARATSTARTGIAARATSTARTGTTRAMPTATSAGTTSTARSMPTAQATTAALCRHDPDYPATLAQLPAAPAVLHASCENARLRELLEGPTVALIGRRHPTGYAREVTFALARDLATAGVTVISGLHQGIDATAHHGALHAGGRTIAVSGCPAEVPYPRQLDHLHAHIGARGAVISEFPQGFSRPRRWCLLAAKRTIAALADVVVIVEAGERSSTLLAAQVAADLGHDVAIIPGRVTDPGSQGTFALLRDGAHPVAGARDVLELSATLATHRSDRVSSPITIAPRSHQ